MKIKKYIKIALFSFAIVALAPGFLLFGSKLANDLKAQFFQPDFSQPPPWETGGNSPYDMQFGMVPDYSQPPPWETGQQNSSSPYGGGIDFSQPPPWETGGGGKQSFDLPTGVIEGAQKGAMGLAELVETNEKLMNIAEKMGINVEKGRKAADRIRPLAKKRTDAIILKNDFDAADKFTNQIFGKDDYMIWFDYLTVENIRKDGSGQLREILKKNIELMSTSLQFEEIAGRETKKMKAKIEQMKRVQKEVEKLPQIQKKKEEKSTLKEKIEEREMQEEKPKESSRESPEEFIKESPGINPVAPSNSSGSPSSQSASSAGPSSAGSSSMGPSSAGPSMRPSSGESPKESHPAREISQPVESSPAQRPDSRIQSKDEEPGVEPDRLSQSERKSDSGAPSGVAVRGSQELAQTLSEIIETEKLNPKIEQKIETLAEKIEKIKVDKKNKKQLEKEIDKFMDKLEKPEISEKELKKIVADLEKTLKKLTKSEKTSGKTADKKTKKRK